jgi:hypothetical protein
MADVHCKSTARQGPAHRTGAPRTLTCAIVPSTPAAPASFASTTCAEPPATALYCSLHPSFLLSLTALARKEHWSCYPAPPACTPVTHGGTAPRESAWVLEPKEGGARGARACMGCSIQSRCSTGMRVARHAATRSAYPVEVCSRSVSTASASAPQSAYWTPGMLYHPAICYTNPAGCWPSLLTTPCPVCPRKGAGRVRGGTPPAAARTIASGTQPCRV